MPLEELEVTPEVEDEGSVFIAMLVRNPFVSIYFLTSNSFFPRTLILLTHVLTFAMLSPYVLSPLFHFASTIHTKSKPL